MPKVLVVDDEYAVRKALDRILADNEYDVIQATHGGIAFEIASEERPDIILLDVDMPVMDGFEVLRNLQENPTTSSIPVVLVTAYPPARGQLLGWDLGVKHYISKPFSPGLVKLTVKVALREAESATDNVAADDASTTSVDS